jgi:hypothetical protein
VSDHYDRWAAWAASQHRARAAVRCNPTKLPTRIGAYLLSPLVRRLARRETGHPEGGRR